MDIREYAHTAELIASPADVETVDTYESRIDHYRNRNYSYIPIPSEEKYYQVEEETLKDLKDSQIVPQSKHLVDVLGLLQNHPFALIDRRYGSAFTVRDGTEITKHSSFNPEERAGVLERLRSDANESEEILLISELRDRYPELVNEASGLHTDYDEQYMIITLADLNKREMREMLYRLLHELESRLSDKIQEEYPNSEDILKDIRAPAIGRWKKDQLEHIQLHIAEHLDIIDMMQVIQASEKSFVKESGFSSKKDVQDSLGRVNDVRNRVMHATRSLVYQRKDIEKILKVVETAQCILSDMD